MTTDTLKYYNQNTYAFIENTVNVDFTYTQDKFIAYLEANAHILDFGCGSGRDTKYFLEHGFSVTAIDGSEELCKYATELTGIQVKQMYFQDLEENEAYDAIWACASILHLSYADLEIVLRKMSDAIKQQGYIYTSFKYGTFEGERNGRYFTDMNEEKFAELLKTVPELKITEQWVTGDVRPGRGDEKWLNLILQKD